MTSVPMTPSAAAESENVLTGVPSSDALEPALRAAGADQVASMLPDGLDSAVTERGRSLSGGQRQRIALARALVRNAPVLVLHDPTTAVDTVTESAIAEGLRQIRAGRTTILLTSSPALLTAADRVLMVHEGRVVADGTHAELMAQQATYQEAVLS